MSAHRRIRRNAGLFALLALAGLSASGCWLSWDDGPAEVTRDFWDAARDGNQEMVEALSVNRLDDFDIDDTDSEIRSISIGDTEIDGDAADVETLLEGWNDDMDVTLEFETALVKRDGEWYVEMDRTTGRLIGAVMAEVGAHVGEAIGEAMEGMAEEIAEGISDGMDELGEALQEAAEDMKDRRDNR